MATPNYTRLALEARAIARACEARRLVLGALEFRDIPSDRLSARLEQLQALLAVTFGQPGEAWGHLNPAIREAHLWACFDLVCAARGDLVCLTAALGIHDP